jgi:salicylate hydroxylase
MKVAIVGGGIGGLTAAVALRRKQIDVSVFERAPALRPIGSSLSLGPNALRLMNEFDLLEPLRSVGVSPDTVDWIRWDDASVLLHLTFGPDMEAHFGAPQLDCFRPDVISLILEHLGEDALTLGAHVQAVSQDEDGAALHFADGATVKADVVIAADGIRSGIRRQLLGDDHPEFSGMVAYRGILDRDRALDLHRVGLDLYWIGPDRHGVSYWLSSGQRLAVTLAVRGAEPATESWTNMAPTSEVLPLVTGWDDGLVERIRRCDAFIKTAVFVRRPVEQWSHGRVTLLGDAAHAMEPTNGQGASQAIEDSYVLAECLSQDPENPTAALARYERLRRMRTKEQQGASKTALNAFFLPDGEEQKARDASWKTLLDTFPWGPRQPIWQHDVRQHMTLS